LTERWISQSEHLLKAMERLSAKKGRDRLEIITSMLLALNALDRSVHGWRSWIGSLRLMSRFTEDELREMEESLVKIARDFVKIDIAVTQKHKDKIPRITVGRRRRDAGRAQGHIV
jgi:hypothetical protein